MKKIYLLYFLQALFLFCSCEEKTIDYLRLSVDSYVFDADASDTLVVDVMTNLSVWKAEPDSDFVKLEKSDDGKLRVYVDVNDQEKTRNAVVNVTAGQMTAVLQLSQLYSGFTGLFMDIPVNAKGTPSRNGKYYAYVDLILVSGDTWKPEAHLIDLETGENKLIEMPELGNGTYYDAIVAVSDDARTMIYSNVSAVITTLVVDGVPVEMTCPDGYHTPFLTNMSADGTVVVGSCKKYGSDAFSHFPAKWVNGEPVLLDYPKKDAIGMDLTNGTMVRGCSADGSVLFGSEWNTKGLVYWKNDVMNNIGIDNSSVTNGESGEVYASLIYHYSETGNISQNGRYIASTFREYERPGYYVDYPVLVDTETGIYTMMDSAPDCGGAAVDSNGTVYCFTPTLGSSEGCVSDFNEETCVSISDYFHDEFGVMIESGRYVEFVSADNNVLAGRRVLPTSTGVRYPYWFIKLK